MIRVVAFSCLACACAVFGQTQASTGVVQGTVTDGSGAAVPSARLTLENAERGLRRATVTDGAGQFALAGVSVGNWTLSVEAAGFAAARTEPFPVSVGQVVVRRMELQPEGVVEKLEVTASGEIVDAAASSASVALAYERIEESPARSRNYLNFVLSAPAVATSAGSTSQRTMTGVHSPLADTGFTFGGLRPRNNSIRIDGMDNRDETTGGNRVAVGLEMVQEFRVTGVSVGADLGGAAGGMLNMVTRSGVNLWHGDLTWFVQNGAFNAKRGEVDESEDPGFERYQPGASAMGPLRRDKTFVAAAVEYERENSDEFSNVPVEAARLVALAPFGLGRDVRRGLYPTGARGVELSSKLDQQLGSGGAASARYAFSRGRVRHEVQGPSNFADRTSQGSSLTTDHSLVASWLRVVGPSTVNDLRVQVAQRSMTLRPNGVGPMFEVPGVVTFGQFVRMDGERRERHLEVVESFHFALGSHRLNAGASAHTVRLDSAMRDRFAGSYVFPSLGALLVASPDLFVQAFGEPRTRIPTTPLSAWLQDRWDLRPSVSLELGVRYEHQLLLEGLPASSHNFAPRLGLAWRPFGTKAAVVRVGAGLFHDRYPLAWLNEAVQKNGLSGFEQYAVGADAVRALSLSRGAVLGAPLGGVARSAYRAADLTSTYGAKVAAGAEFGIAKDTSLSVEAAKIRGVHLPRTRNGRGTLPPGYVLETAAESSYSGATVALNRRLNKEIAALVSYSVGRTRDNGSDFDEHPANPLDARADWALSRQDQRHRLAASALFELPVEDAEFLPKAVREALEDISVAPIFTAGAGRPINALLTTDAYRTGGYPISARPLGVGRNPYWSPKNVSLDVRVMKTIPMLEHRAVLQFGVEGFNVFNHTNPERVSPWFAEAGGSRLATYGGVLESLPARQVQFMMQFEF